AGHLGTEEVGGQVPPFSAPSLFGDSAVIKRALDQPPGGRDDARLLVPDSAEELDRLERSRLHLASIGSPLELWEVLLLTQSGAWDAQRRSAAAPARALLQLRESEGPFIRDLRFFL